MSGNAWCASPVSTDIEKTFDQLEALSVEWSIPGAPGWAIAAVLRELLGQQALATVAGVMCKDSSTIGGGTRKAPRAPSCHQVARSERFHRHFGAGVAGMGGLE